MKLCSDTFLEAAAKSGTEIAIVLDRPDPINGAFVQGPPSDPDAASYVDSMPIPVRHGMTLGELARYDNEQLHLERASYTVIALKGMAAWEIGMTPRACLGSIPPPTLRDLEEATLTLSSPWPNRINQRLSGARNRYSI